MATLAEIREEIAAKSKSLHDIFEQAGPDLDMSKVTVIDGDSAAKAAEMKRRNDELTALGVKFDELRELDDMAKAAKERSQFFNAPATRQPFPTGDGREPEREETKSIGQRFIEHLGYKDGRGAANPRISVEIPGVSLKTTMTTAAGFAPYPSRTNIVVDSAQRRPVVADLIPQEDTQSNAIIYMEETTFTNNAAPVAENAVKPESALAWTQRTQPVEVIAHLIPVTKQQLEDVAAMRGIIDNRLSFMLLLAEEAQLLTGDGNSPNLQGFLTKTGVQTQAKSTDPTPDAFYKAMTKVRFTGFAEPSGAVVHPNDWQDIRLLRTSDGVYIWGSPADAGPERIWGIPVIVTTAETEGTGLVGDFRLYSHISRREGITIDVSDSHDTYFAYNRLAVRAEERLSLEIYRAAAFAKVTGI